MLTFTSATPIYLVAGVTDMRNSFDGLSAIVTNHLHADPLSGAVFVFCNRKRDRIKLLVWDCSGYWVFAKRLERGTFAWPTTGQKAIDLSREELTLLVGGIDLRHTRARRWYRREQTSRFSS